MPKVIVDLTPQGCPPNNCLCYFPGETPPDSDDPTLLATYYYANVSVDLCMVSTHHFQLFFEDRMLRDYHAGQPPSWAEVRAHLIDLGVTPD